jgi:hypothetical protein
MPFAAPQGESPKADRREGQSPQPSISLPEGGGAIREMGEKVTANPVTGTGSTTAHNPTAPSWHDRGGESGSLLKS